MKTALVTGISGQDGAYLAKLLLEKGYQVWGTSRDAQISSFKNLERLSLRKEVQLASVALNDFRSVIQVLFKVQPDEVYNLGGQSSVSLSFEQPMEAPGRGNASKAAAKLGWKPKYKMDDVARMMVEAVQAPDSTD